MKFYYIFVLVLILIFTLTEKDRLFNSNENQDYVYTLKSYYYDDYSLIGLGIYNTITRLSNPTHTHFFKSENFTSDKIIKSNYELIKNEALKIYNKNNLMNMKDLSDDHFGSIDKKTNLWKVYVLKWYNKINKSAYKECPNTCKVIDQCDDVHAAMFSIVEPGNYIRPHKGPSTGSLRYHLGLSVPKDKENCYITVNNEKFIWEEGKSLVFDDTYIHSVYNNTSEPRIILFLDIERPTTYFLSKLNKYLLQNSQFISFVKKVNDSVEKKQSIIKETFVIQINRYFNFESLTYIKTI